MAMIFGIYDLEIAKAIPPKDDADRLEDIEYCAGLTDYANMGIACWALCYLDTEDWSISEPIGGEDIEDLIADWNDQDLIGNFDLGGFNSRKFDDNLVAAQGISDMRSNFDILEMVLEAAGMKDVKYWEMEPKRSYSLAAISETNGYVKTLSGELAPIEWQRGNKGIVIDYCKNDVRIEAMTLKLLLQGELIDPNTGDKLLYPMPGIAVIV